MDKAFKKKIEDLISLNPATLERRELGTLGFKENLDFIIELHTDLVFIAENIIPNTNLYSDSNLTAYETLITNFLKEVGNINSYDPSTDASHIAKKQNIIRQLNTIRNSINNTHLGLMNSVRLSTIKTKDFEKLVGDMKKSKKEADDILNNIRESSAKKGAGEQADIFGTQASDYNEASKVWFWTSTILFGLIIGFLIWVMCWGYKSIDFSSTPSVIYHTSLRVLIISVLSVGLFQSLRLYRSNKHLQSVNLHRQNIQNSFKYFVDALPINSENRQLVVLEATKSVFNEVQTGFLGSDTTSNNSLSLTLSDLISSKGSS